MNTSLEQDSKRIATTLLRVSLGTMYLAHSIVLKLATFGIGATVGYFVSLGLPAATAYAVIAAEIAGGVLLIANIATRWVALALLPILIGAAWVHAPNGWVFNATGGGWEYPLFLIVVSIAVAAQAVAPVRVKGASNVNKVGHSPAL